MQETEEVEDSSSNVDSNETFEFFPVPELQQEDMSTPPTGPPTAPTGPTTTPTGPTTAATNPTGSTGTAPGVQNTFGARTYTVRDLSNPKPISADPDEVLHPSNTRASLSADDRAKIFEKAVKTAHKKYELMPLSLEDADKLDEAYNLDILIKYTRRSHTNYDMHDVFLIVYPKKGLEANVVDYTKDLYTEYPDITIEDVVQSNKWYRTWMNEEWFIQNLQLTHTFFQHNVSDELWMKISETCEAFKAGEKGGPLFFILMMNHLLSDTEEAASALVTKVKTFKIRKLPGKDIYKVVSLLRGAINCLNYIHKLPEDIIKILLQVFQTSLVADFNSTFLLLEKQRKQQAVLLRTGAPPDILASDIFTFAESKYRDMQTQNKWSGVHIKGELAFHAGSPGPGRVQQVCFNCGGTNHVKQCTLPRDGN
jgi:hypothetical protein